MYATFNWAYETQGTSAFIEYSSNPRKTANVAETVNSPRPNIASKTPSTVRMSPKIYPDYRTSDNRTSAQQRNYRDVGVGVKPESLFQPTMHQKSGDSKTPPFQAKRRNRGRSISVENDMASAGFGRHDKGLDKYEFPFDTYRRVHAFEERVSGLDQQLNIIQKMINQTLAKNMNLEDEIDKASRHKKHEAEYDTDNSTLKKQRRTLRDQEESRKEAESELKIIKLQGQLQDVQVQIQDLSARHEEQRVQLNKAMDGEPSEEWKTLALQSNELLGKLDTMAQQVGDNIRSYLEKYDQQVSGTVFNHLETLGRKLENNLGEWNQEMKQKREFGEKLLQECGNRMTQYQREIETLQGQKSDKEASLEQLRAEFSSERQRLNDEHIEQLNIKATEYTRLADKQQRKQERLTNWYIRKIDEKDDRWQERIASVQEKNADLVRASNEQQIEHEREARRADEEIQDLTAEFNKVKQDLDAMGKVNDELGVLVNESKQRAPDEFHVLREELDELAAKNKDYLEEIKQFRVDTKDLKEQVRDSEENLKGCRQELVECRGKLEEAPRKIQELEEAFVREKTLLEKEHQRHVRAEQEKLERLEQAADSVGNLRREQTEQHSKALEENARKWQDDLDKRRIEWQKELDQAHDLVREAEAKIHSRDAKIETLQQEVQESRNRVHNLASELDRMKETSKSAIKTQEELTHWKQAAEGHSRELQRALEGAENENKSLHEQVAQLRMSIQNTARENEALETNLKATKEELAARVKEVSAAPRESEQKRQLTILQSQVEQTQKQLLGSELQIKQKDSQLEKLRASLKNEQNRREEIDARHQSDREENERRIAELITQLDGQVKQLKEVESLHAMRITEQNKLLNQRNKTIKALEENLIEARRDNEELHETMKAALDKEESKRSLIFNEFQKLRKEIRVMCRIRPSTSRDGAILEYETSEGKFHSKPAGLEIISQKSQYGTTRQVKDRSKHYRFDRVFEAQETNEDVWLEISQFVQSFIEGRQVTILCYGQTATGKTYTMSNSEGAVDANGDAILTNEGIMPRSKGLIFEEAARRRQKGWSIAVRGCCYEVYVKEIRQLLPHNKVKTKSLDPTEPPWWHVRDPEYQSLNSAEDFDAMFDSAMATRTFAETTSNSNSSRSHFILYLEFEAKSPTMKKAKKGILCLVDLAGSEDPHKASALDDAGVPGRGSSLGVSEDAERKKIRERRLREGIAINQSLRVLRKSISKIRNPTAASGKPTLEGGDEESSTLAKLLGPCLGRESMVLMFVMINLEAGSLAETKATLESGKEANRGNQALAEEDVVGT
ncbi:hypothetical protein EKO27_g11313 [Xylaria grammica]|uniref:Kinesin motor domain-containing protein n=1 Tax=Xylaria grammica TaxID=363999 RepID=A0A439CNQ5_9PEZI|nr:hypothetical protein EKO27_g11313 [Xylaria grammica]